MFHAKMLRLVVMKRCSKCHFLKELTSFALNKGMKDGRANQCKICKNLWKPDPLKTKDRKLKARHGITLEQFNKMKLEQANNCFICNDSHATLRKGLCVDHNHVTGQIRGLLCDRCNRGLGYFRDNTELLLKASIYLNIFKS
jgi:hypothetical protein